MYRSDKVRRLSHEEPITLEVTPDQDFIKNDPSAALNSSGSSSSEPQYVTCSHTEIFSEACCLIEELILEKESVEEGLNSMLLKFCTLSSKLNKLKHIISQDSPFLTHPIPTVRRKAQRPDRAFSNFNSLKEDEDDRSQIDVGESFIAPTYAETLVPLSDPKPRSWKARQQRKTFYSKRDRSLEDLQDDALSEEEEEIVCTPSFKTESSDHENPVNIRLKKVTLEGNKPRTFKYRAKKPRRRFATPSEINDESIPSKSDPKAQSLRSIVRKMEGERRGSSIYIDGNSFVYFLSRKNKNGTKCLRCKHKSCPATGSLIGANLQLHSEHDHANDEHYVALCKFLAAVKERARTEPDSLLKIYKEEYKKHASPNTWFPTLASLRSTLYKQRERGLASGEFPCFDDMEMEQSS